MVGTWSLTPSAGCGSMTDDHLAGSEVHLHLVRYDDSVEDVSTLVEAPVRVELNLPDEARNLLMDDAHVNINLHRDPVGGGKLTLNLDAERASAVSFEDWQAGNMGDSDG